MNSCAFLAFLAALSPQASLEAELDAYLKNLVAANQFSGVVAIMKDGKVVVNKGYGYADFKTKEPNTPNTVFGIASVTKTFTIAVANVMLEEQKLGAEDKLSKFIPDFPKGDKITVTTLATHRAGIPHRVTTEDEENVPRTTTEMIERIKKAQMVAEPGERRVYSSAGYTVLARVLEIAGGKSYIELLTDKILAKTGTTSIREFSPDIKRAKEHSLRKDGPVASPYKDYSFLVGAGSLVATAEDVLVAFDAMAQGKLGDEVKAGVVPRGTAASNGQTNGYRCYVNYTAANRTGFVVCTNVDSGANDMLRADLPKILAGEKVEAPKSFNPVPIPLTEAQLKDYEGVYMFDGRDFFFKVQNGELWAERFQLIPTGKDKFFTMEMFNELTFGRDEVGKVNSVKWVGQRGEETTWTRQR